MYPKFQSEKVIHKVKRFGMFKSILIRQSQMTNSKISGHLRNGTLLTKGSRLLPSQGRVSKILPRRSLLALRKDPPRV